MTVTRTDSPPIEARTATADPVFILAPPCTFSWVVCAMLGQHPELYGLPELHLFTAPTVAEWWERCAEATFEMDHGLVRTVAELFYGEQTDDSAARARGWLRRRGHFTTGLLFETIVERLAPLAPVEKSPSVVFRSPTLERAFEMFPNARFVHLVSHPRLYGEAVIESLHEAARGQTLPPSHWLVQLAAHEPSGAELDPQVGWFDVNRRIAEFLDRVPPERRLVVRGEELVAASGDGLRDVAAWLGLRTDAGAVEEMLHPERSPFARPGPPSAAFGSDVFLRGGPLVREEWTQTRSLDGPLEWRQDDGEFLPHVRELAERFGYR